MEKQPNTQTLAYKAEQEERKKSYFAMLDRQRIQERIRRAHDRMQRMRVVMNMASLAVIFAAKSPTSREERRVKSADAQQILQEQGRFARLL